MSEQAVTIPELDEHGEIYYRKVPIDAVLIHRDGETYLSTETEDGKFFADYYGEFRGNMPWISQEAKEYATERGCFWEWVNPGTLQLTEA